MKTCHYAAVPALVLLMAGAALSGSALAGEVYQCTGGSSPVYQDQPCPGNPNQSPRMHYGENGEARATEPAPVTPKPATPPADPNQKRLTEIYTGLHQAEQDRNRVEQGQQADIAAAQLRNKDNKASADAAVRAVNERWNAQVKEVQQRQDGFAAEAHQLCPNSAEITSAGKCR